MSDISSPTPDELTDALPHAGHHHFDTSAAQFLSQTKTKLVLVGNPDEARWPAHSQSERATAVLRADQPIS